LILSRVEPRHFRGITFAVFADAPLAQFDRRIGKANGRLKPASSFDAARPFASFADKPICRRQNRMGLVRILESKRRRLGCLPMADSPLRGLLPD